MEFASLRNAWVQPRLVIFNTRASVHSHKYNFKKQRGPIFFFLFFFLNIIFFLIIKIVKITPAHKHKQNISTNLFYGCIEFTEKCFFFRYNFIFVIIQKFSLMYNTIFLYEKHPDKALSSNQNLTIKACHIWQLLNVNLDVNFN